MADRLRLYLDNSAMNRPFDDQSQPRIAAETQGLVSILEMINSGQVALITSTVVAFENARNSFPPRKRWVEQISKLAKSTSSPASTCTIARWNWRRRA